MAHRHDTDKMGATFVSRRLYALSQRRLNTLMPYRHILWESLKGLRLESDSKVLAVNDNGCFGRFLTEKGVSPGELRSVGYFGGSDEPIMPGEPLPFAESYYDRAFVDVNGPDVNRIFFINELKRIMKPDGLVVVIEKNTGPKASWDRMIDHLRRVSNIWGRKRQAAAILKLVCSIPALGLSVLLENYIAAASPSAETLIDNGWAIVTKTSKNGDRIHIGALRISIVETNPLMEAFINYSRKFDLRFPTTAPPSNRIVNVTPADLKRNRRSLDELATSYQDIFGASDVWAEGAFCNLNPKHLISLEKYNETLSSGNLKCPCGGTFQPCYSKAYFRKLIIRRLTKDKRYNPYCGLYVTGNRVTGFMWGAVSNLDDAIARILDIPKWIDKSRWRDFADEVRTRLMREFGLTKQIKIFYMDDLGVRREERKGIDPMMLLSRQGFSHAVVNDCQRALCWTSKKAPLYRLLSACAFQEVAADNDEIVFMYSPDILPALRILQQGPRTILPIIVRNTKLALSTPRQGNLG